MILENPCYSQKMVNKYGVDSQGASGAPFNARKHAIAGLEVSNKSSSFDLPKDCSKLDNQGELSIFKKH